MGSFTDLEVAVTTIGVVALLIFLIGSLIAAFVPVLPVGNVLRVLLFLYPCSLFQEEKETNLCPKNSLVSGF